MSDASRLHAELERLKSLMDEQEARLSTREVPLSVHVPGHLRKRLKVCCVVQGMQMKAAVEQAIIDWCDKHCGSLESFRDAR